MISCGYSLRLWLRRCSGLRTVVLLLLLVVLMLSYRASRLHRWLSCLLMLLMLMRMSLLTRCLRCVRASLRCWWRWRLLMLSLRLSLLNHLRTRCRSLRSWRGRLKAGRMCRCVLVLIFRVRRFILWWDLKRFGCGLLCEVLLYLRLLGRPILILRRVLLRLRRLCLTILLRLG